MTDKPYCSKLDQSDCNDFQVNIFIEWFYILYALYFVIIALQIRHGLPSFKKISFPLMRNTSMSSLRLFKLYLAMPFLFELRTLMDWTFTETALDIFQWFKFEDINAQLYITQCNQLSYSTHPRTADKKSSKIGVLKKAIMGCFMIFLICFVILVPLIIFSSLNPIIESNQVL